MKSKVLLLAKILLSTIGVMAIFIGIVGAGNFFQSHGHKNIGNLFMVLFPVAVYGYVYWLNGKINGLALRDYGFAVRRLPTQIFTGFLSATALTLIVLVASTLILGITVDFAGFKPDAGHSILNLVGMLIIVGVWEEFYFRGFVFNTLVKGQFGFHASALISALLFSVIHWSSFDMAVTSWLWYIGIVFIGYILVLIYVLTRSIWSVAVFHFFWNLYAFLFDAGENEVGLFSIRDYTAHSKAIDNITVVTLGIALVALLAVKRCTIKRMFPPRNMFAFPGRG